MAHLAFRNSVFVAACTVLACVFFAAVSHADETCNSPYMSKLIKGQEDYVYVWALGVDGVGDGSDKLVTVDVHPKSKRYGKVISSVSIGIAHRGPSHGLHRRSSLPLGGGPLGQQDLRLRHRDRSGEAEAGPDHRRPRRARPAISGRIPTTPSPAGCSCRRCPTPRTRAASPAWRVYNNKGEYIASYAMPTEGGGDGYGYDLAVNPKKNVLLTSSFTGYANYMRPLGELVKDAEAMKHFGNTMVAWDLKAMKPTKVFSVPGAPLEIRWSLAPADNWAVTAAALTSKIWLVKQDAAGEWQAKEVATIGDPAKIPLPVDISITRDGKGLWVNTFMDGTTRYFDLSNPEAPKQTYAKVTGKQVNMISQSWDGKRVYITSSLLANWDKGGADNEQFLRGLHLGRQGADADVRGRFHEGEAGPRASHEARLEVAARRPVSRPRALALLAGLACASARAGVRRTTGEPLPALDFEPPRAGHVHAAPHHGGARRRGAGHRRSPAAAVALHARAHHRCSDSSTRRASIPRAARSPTACSTR